MIIFPPALVAEAIHQSVREAPNEACGLISQGRDGLRLHATRNAAGDPTCEFVVDPDDQVTIAVGIVRQERKLVGLFHSHPGRGPEPSDGDLAMAKVWPGLTWLIVGLRGSEDVAAAEHWAGVLAPD